MQSPVPRLATLEDLAGINSIYNHYVLTSTATYQTSPETTGARHAWFTGRDQTTHPVMVVELNDQIAAWGSISPFGKREAFAGTVENSIYVHPDFQRQGLGRMLLLGQTAHAARVGHHTIIAAISAEQSGSLALHFAQGFTESGRLREAGWKFGQWLDLVYLQKMVQTPRPPGD